jgi:HSP20 family protein
MFGRHHSAGYGPAHFFGAGYRRPKYNVPMNVLEKESAYEVHLYATGFDKANVKISVVEDILYVSGTRTLPADEEPAFRRQEFPVKSFERVLNLNRKVDTTQISATQTDGVLVITLPKSAESQRPAQEVMVI